MIGKNWPSSYSHAIYFRDIINELNNAYLYVCVYTKIQKKTRHSKNYENKLCFQKIQQKGEINPIH